MVDFSTFSVFKNYSTDISKDTCEVSQSKVMAAICNILIVFSAHRFLSAKSS